jgi:hypothetical protein
VQLAFGNGRVVVDKEFKGTRENLAKNAKRYGGEITNATGSVDLELHCGYFADLSEYKIDVAKRAAICRGVACLDNSTEIPKGELRLGLCVPVSDGEHKGWQFKH